MDTSLIGVIKGKIIFSVKDFRNILSVFSCVSVTEVQVQAKLSGLFHLFLPSMRKLVLTAFK